MTRVVLRGGSYIVSTVNGRLVVQLAPIRNGRTPAKKRKPRRRFRGRTVVVPSQP